MEKINTIEINLIKLLVMLLEQIEVFQILDTHSKLKHYTSMSGFMKTVLTSGAPP